MKKVISTFLLFTIFSCNQSTTPEKNNLANSQTKAKEFPICKNREFKNPDHPEDPNIVRTCIWRKYKFIKRGSADNMGRYSWDYEVFEILDNKKDSKIKNSDIFNSTQINLEKEINKKINDDLVEMKKDEELKDCFSNFENRMYKLDEMEISFEQKGFIVFSVKFGLGSACMSVDGTEVQIPIKEIEKFVK
ncbi:MAG: hypothetical protein WCO43_08905 [Chitinophagia bacterium]